MIFRFPNRAFTSKKNQNGENERHGVIQFF